MTRITRVNFILRIIPMAVSLKTEETLENSMLSQTEVVRLDFDILHTANRGAWKNIENVAEAFVTAQISIHQVFGRIDFLANRGCIDMREPSSDSRSVYIMVNASVPTSEFEIAMLLIDLHPVVRKISTP